MYISHFDSQYWVDSVCPDINQANKPDQFFLEHTILSSKNDTIDGINLSILDIFPGELSIDMSVDKVNSDNSHHYPVEFLSSINVSGLPLAHLALKPGCPLMLLHNLDPANGLCNGTHMVLLKVRMMILRCRILGGNHTGNVIFIPRMTLEPSSEGHPIELSHHQFPVHLAFAMTINKAQAQSIINVGIDLHIKVVFPVDSNSTDTMNIVYIEVLSGMVSFFLLSVVPHLRGGS